MVGDVLPYRFGFSTWFHVPGDGGRSLRGRRRSHIRTMDAKWYPGFCAGKREAERRLRQMARQK